MKKICGILLLMLLIGLVAACGNSDVSVADDTGEDSTDALSENLVMLDAGEWPQNEYTANISQPESGTVAQGWIDPDHHRCYIDMTGVSSEAMEDWYNALLNSGFTEDGKAVEEIEGQDYISINAQLQKDGVCISVTHLSTDEGNLELYITMEESDG